MTTLEVMHIKAFLTNFELACEAGILALMADLLWLTHDIVVNGAGIVYGVVGMGLAGGILLTSYALVRHHKYYTHRLMRKKSSGRQGVLNGG